MLDESGYTAMLQADDVNRRFGRVRQDDEITNAPQRLAQRHALLLEAEQIQAFRADESVCREGADLLGGERARPPNFSSARRATPTIRSTHP